MRILTMSLLRVIVVPDVEHPGEMRERAVRFEVDGVLVWVADGVACVGVFGVVLLVLILVLVVFVREARRVEFSVVSFRALDGEVAIYQEDVEDLGL